MARYVTLLLVVLLLGITLGANGGQIFESDEYEYIDPDEEIARLEGELRNAEKRLRSRIDRVQTRSLNRVRKMLPRILETQLIDLLRYHKFDRMLGQGQETQTKRMQHDLHQMKTRVEQLSREVKGYKEENVLLQKQLEKTRMCGGRLEQELELLKVKVDDVCVDGKPTLCQENYTSTNSDRNEHVQDVKSLTVNNVQTQSTEVVTTSMATTVAVARENTVRTKMIAVGANTPQFVEINLKTKETRNVTTTSGTVGSLVYSPVHGEIIFSSYDRKRELKGIFSFKLDSPSEHTQLSTMVATAMDVDVKRHWVVYVSAEPNNGIYRIRPWGNGYNLIYYMNRLPFQRGITLDTKKQLIYTCNGDYIFETDYSGNRQRRVVSGAMLLSVSFDPETQILYFSRVGLRHEINLWNQRTERIVWLKSISGLTGDYLYNNGDLYITTKTDGIKVMNVKTRNISKLSNISRGSITLVP